MKWDLATIGIVTAIFFLGYIIGLVEAAIKQNIKDKKKTAETEKEAKETKEQSPVAVKETNLFSLNRNDSTALVVEVEGQTFTNKEELTTDSRRKVINLLGDLRPWLETAADIPTTPPEKLQPEPIKTQPMSAQPVPIPGRITPLLTKKIPAVKPVASIVSQIDDVLQERLAVSPLAGKGIRLVESSSGGVLVYIGLQKFDGIDALPDPEIQAFIRQSVAEWEKRS